MTDKIPIIIIGAGGHAHACIDVLEATGSYVVKGLVERDGAEMREVLGYPVIGHDSQLENLLASCRCVLVAIGQIADAGPRRRVFERLLRLNAELPVVKSPSAVVSRHARVGAGALIMHGAIVNAGARIGENCIINTRALVEHDVEVGAHCHISTGALVNGGSVIGEGSFIGSGAVIRDGVRVGAGSVIGAGCRIMHDCPDGTFLKAPL